MAADCSISILLDKDAFFGGDLLSGTVVVEVLKPFACRELIVTLTGREQVLLRDRVDNNGHTIERINEHEVIDRTVVAAEFNDEIQCGEHSYPFMIELPDDLPGQFSIADTQDGKRASSSSEPKASLVYHIKATLYAADLATRLLIAPAEKIVTIHQSPSLKLKPSHDSRHRRVNFLYCIDRGACQVTASLNEASYSPGDTAIIHIQVKNESLVNVTSLRCCLYQEVIIRTSTGRESSRRSGQVVAWYELAGVSAGVAASYHQEIVLLAKDGQPLNPSMRGALIECSYRVGVECDVPWNPDFDLHLPLTLVAPANQRQSQVIIHGTAFLEAF